nr:unnamed protein product [Digitaria exilis]
MAPSSRALGQAPFPSSVFATARLCNRVARLVLLAPARPRHERPGSSFPLRSLHMAGEEVYVDWRGNAVDERRHGGIRATLFLSVLFMLRSCPSSSNFSVVAYFHGTLHLDIVTSSTVIGYLVGAVLMSAALMNFISDAYIKRTTAIFVFGPCVVLALVISLRKRQAIVDVIELHETSRADRVTKPGATQVDETMGITRMLPIFISCLLIYLPFTLLMTLTIQVGSTMDRRVGTIKIPSASLIAIPTAFHMLMQPCYSRILTPLLRTTTGHEFSITPLKRIGAGSVCGTAAACVATLVEVKRLTVAEQHGLALTGTGVPMSIFWLVIQFFLLSIMDVASFSGLIEFIKSEAPPAMKPIAPAMQSFLAGVAACSCFAFTQLVNRATRGSDGSRGWLDGTNFNRTRLDHFFLVLAAFELVALINYTFWARRYTRKLQRISTFVLEDGN